MNKNEATTFALIPKILPKLIALYPKMKVGMTTLFKTLFSIKAAGLIASTGLYSFLFNWRTAVSLIIFIGIHEYGHLWAMKYCGIRTKGMFFLPGFGAVAVADEKFKSARNEIFIALLGPVFGLIFFILPAFAYNIVTGNQFALAFATSTTLINLINMLPIMPLDGGRCVKALAYTHKHIMSLGVSLLLSAIGVLFAEIYGFGVIVYISIIGFLETLSDYGMLKKIRDTSRLIGRGFVYWLLYYMIHLMLNAGADSSTNLYLFSVSRNALELTFEIFTATLLVMIIIGDAISLSKNYGYSFIGKLFWYPVKLWEIAGKAFTELRAFRTSDIEPLENYEIMSLSNKLIYGFLFVTLIVSHILTIGIMNPDFLVEILK